MQAVRTLKKHQHPFFSGPCKLTIDLQQSEKHLSKKNRWILGPYPKHKKLIQLNKRKINTPIKNGPKICTDTSTEKVLSYTYWTIHFKWVHFILCKLNISGIDFKFYIKTSAKYFRGRLTKKYAWMTNKPVKRCSISLVITKRQNKAPVGKDWHG